mgnify:CR=1 FL=1
MREAVVVASSRTPLAKSQRGSFNQTLPSDLAAHCISDALGKSPLDAALGQTGGRDNTVSQEIAEMLRAAAQRGA